MNDSELQTSWGTFVNYPRKKKNREEAPLGRRMKGRKHKYQMAKDPDFPLCGVCCVFPHEAVVSDNSQWGWFSLETSQTAESFKMSKNRKKYGNIGNGLELKTGNYLNE